VTLFTKLSDNRWVKTLSVFVILGEIGPFWQISPFYANFAFLSEFRISRRISHFRANFEFSGEFRIFKRISHSKANFAILGENRKQFLPNDCQKIFSEKRRILVQNYTLKHLFTYYAYFCL
jgi:hypothetical protein